jgi:hypothetical protein
MLKDSDQENTKYLLVTNIDSEPVDARIIMGHAITNITSVFDGRSVPFSGGTFTEQYGGYGVGLYKVELNLQQPVTFPPVSPPPPPPVRVRTFGVVKNGTWHLKYTQSGGPADQTFAYGNATDIPVVGDWNSDGIHTPGVVRNNSGFLTWYIKHKLDSGEPNITVSYGRAGDKPVVGDWDGDGWDNIGVFGNGTFLLTNDFGQTITPVGFGLGGDQPVAGDWDGDGTDTVGVFRAPGSGLATWFLLDEGGGITAVQYGQAGDLPVVGDWNGDGRDDIGVLRNGVWIISTNHGVDSHIIPYGDPGDLPIAGHWKD